MKQRIPDQAEKLRQLAAKEKTPAEKKDSPAGVLEPKEPEESLFLTESLLSSPDTIVFPDVEENRVIHSSAPILTPDSYSQQIPDPIPVAVTEPAEPVLDVNFPAEEVKQQEFTEGILSEAMHRDELYSELQDVNPPLDTTLSIYEEIPVLEIEQELEREEERITETARELPEETADIQTESFPFDETVSFIEEPFINEPILDEPVIMVEEPFIEEQINPPAEKPHPSTVKLADIMQKKRFPLEGKTQVIAVTGGKGGVGKSNIACNLGLAFCQMKKRVLLLDADLSLANIDVLLGITPRLNLSHVIRGEKSIEEILVEGPEGISIIPGGSGIEELSNISEGQMERVFEAFARLYPAPDVLIIDTAAGIHPNVIQFLLAADQTIVVTTPEPTAYTDAYALIKTLVKHDPNKEIGVLVNMVNNTGEATEVMKLLLQICRQMLHITFNNIGYIPRDPAVLKSVRRQKPFLLYDSSSPASQAIRRIASTVLQIETKDTRPRGLGHFFRRLLGGYKVPKAAESL